jgi:2-keto-4-pentenoate hydratase
MSASPLSDAELDAVADRLAADIAIGDHFPAWLPGSLDLDASLAVQARLLRRRVAEGERLAGWKVGLTSDRARRALGADARPFGFLLAGHVFASESDVPVAPIRRPSIEPEFLFTIGRRLSGPDLSPDDVRAGVERVAAGFEINERRAGTARPDLVAMATDRMTQWGVVEGSGMEPAGVDLDAVEVRMWCDDDERLSTHSPRRSRRPLDLDRPAGDGAEPPRLGVGTRPEGDHRWTRPLRPRGRPALAGVVQRDRRRGHPRHLREE